MYGGLLRAVKFGDLYQYRAKEIAENFELAKSAIFAIFDDYDFTDYIPQIKMSGRFGYLTMGKYIYSKDLIEIGKPLLAYGSPGDIIGVAKHEALHAICYLYYQDKKGAHDGSHLFESLLSIYNAPTSAANRGYKAEDSVAISVSWNYEELIQDAEQAYGDVLCDSYYCENCHKFATDNYERDGLKELVTQYVVVRHPEVYHYSDYMTCSDCGSQYKIIQTPLSQLKNGALYIQTSRRFITKVFDVVDKGTKDVRYV